MSDVSPALSSMFTDGNVRSVYPDSAAHCCPKYRASDSAVCSSSGLCSTGFTLLHIQIPSNLNLSLKYVASINSLSFEFVEGFGFCCINIFCSAGRGLKSCSNEESRHLLARLSFMTQLSQTILNLLLPKSLSGSPHSRVCNPVNQERPFLPQLR